MKRKTEIDHAVNGAAPSKKRAISDSEAHKHFRTGLFEADTLNIYQSAYVNSQPYKHGVISDLISTDLLRDVRQEIRNNISFTPKETDIYRIHQSGDLANLDGLDDSSLKLLPSLLTLRDAMYSSAFRKYIASVTGSGPLSGVKTDMAVNIYTPGCHLLCHDDVIGSRRVSYILYLLDPDRPWKPEWGGALRLYPTELCRSEDGTEMKVPTADFTVSIPPAFNQLSFFTVQPGESFHDVEEVYHKPEGLNEDDGGRVRMAISGWFHIPQQGEEGYEEGLEEKLAERSSLQQLQGKSDKFDLPQPAWKESEKKSDSTGADDDWTEDELTFLLRFMNPNYLVPDVVDQLKDKFEEDASLRLVAVLSPKFAVAIRDQIEAIDGTDQDLPASSTDAAAAGVARPPYKKRFQYRRPSKPNTSEPTAYDELIDTFFPSPEFKKWLSMATGLPLNKANILARRFRRGKDYSLATSYDEEDPQLEVCLGITPSTGWAGEDEDDEEDEDEDEIPPRNKENGSSSKPNGAEKKANDEMKESIGGYELYMAAEDDPDDAGSDDGVEIPNGGPKSSSHTGAGNRRKADPAVYRSSGADEDDGILFSSWAGWNTMSLVLRDRGVLRFVKYVSKAAKGDRWDVLGEWGVDEEEEEVEAEDGDVDGGSDGVQEGEDEEGEDEDGDEDDDNDDGADSEEDESDDD
ncbi:hypothetical protein EJ05DRAFT_541231 [Pseudovirgaria hyperparasitica]|uniref:uS12 prolyl 3,4-dihydroxylase n=1 Tax=Pseudovirgaria hyperparasitica TaxID=470096 RepID=A0A6A6VVA1_9PEZI|nr:uncharacterized protein EJ05DRAFT_541231 [Pseudovirgaria hyperparasitica]KAF2754095.1 hypothetical protein EJ05DRAFT_541231 [Pseudovirgaria hyperparasitica]